MRRLFYLLHLHEVFHIPDASNFNLKVILAGMLLGFPLSLLFFMDQNIAESMVNSPDNKLVKVGKDNQTLDIHPVPVAKL